MRVLDACHTSVHDPLVSGAMSGLAVRVEKRFFSLNYQEHSVGLLNPVTECRQS